MCIRTVLLGALALLAPACGHQAADAGTKAPAASRSVSPLVASPAVPSMPPPPAEAAQHITPDVAALLRSLPAGVPKPSCDGQRGAVPGMSSGADLSPQTPTTLRGLASSAVVVAVVKAESQTAYWHRPAPGEPLAPGGAMPVTATDFHVEQAVKGRVGTWMQVVQEGAKPRALSVCDALGYVVPQDPLPVVGQEYVIFAQAALGGDRYEVRYGAYEEFPLVNGIVWPASYISRSAISLPNFTGEPLGQFSRDVSS